ncbi:MAG: Cof-type HAD-IIB family hydrolase [Cardiobacterium sp.]
MNTPRAIFFDIDRTLYDHRSDFVPPSTLAAIAALRARGIVPAIATGRGFAALPPRIAQLVESGEIELVISSNGQYNRLGARVLSEHTLPPADIESLTREFRARDWEFTFVSERHMAAGLARGSSHRLLQGYPCYIVAPDYFREHAVHQMVVLVTAAEEAALQAVLADHGGRYRSVRSHASAVDLLHADGSKARGIADACAALGFAPQETMAFGDGLNDVEMFAAVGCAVAMGDACDALKAVASHITGTLEEDGIARALLDLGVLEAADLRAAGANSL